MMEIKTASYGRDLFARKGEAMPTSAVEAGFKPKPVNNPFAGAAVDGDFPGNKGQGAAGLSFLITRCNPRVPVKAPEAFHRMAPPKRLRTAEKSGKAEIRAVEANRRYSFTVRLEPVDRKALTTLAIRSGRTYQAIIESAIRNTLKETGNKAGEKALDEAIDETSHLEPATMPRALSKLISRV